MCVSVPTSAAWRTGTRRLGARFVAAVLALLLASPLLATVWNRSKAMVQLPKGTGRVEVANASYAARDWNVALKALEIKEVSRPVGGIVTVVWVFHYTNTDKEPHYAALSVQCLDARRTERARFDTKVTLEANRPDGGTVEVSAKLQQDTWAGSSFARVVIDFLSTKEG